jgi:hypothetical protein
MLNPKNREGLSKGDASFLEIIDKYGWHVMTVAPRVDSQDKQEWFSYSTGLYARFQQPEVIIFGLDNETASGMVNEIGSGFKAGRKFSIGTDCEDIFADGVLCQFKEVHSSWYPEYVGFSQWFYEGEYFPLWQCFWPDDSGFFPWQPECHPEVAESQPLLFVPRGIETVQ